jgi:redox-sensitive bicupin YhaK (pirin superfamily)
MTDTTAPADPNAAVRLHPRATLVGGGLPVKRVLPAAARRHVGPFVFFDHFGPVTVPPELDTDVGPHPHIGLATVTYLFEGAMLHRDSLGNELVIAPGAVNWMSAGRGIVHSERTPPALIGQPRPLHGLQLWVALPATAEQGEPSFQHVAAVDIPQLSAQGTAVRVLVGEAFGVRSPVVAASPTLYLDIALRAGQPFTLPALAEELAVYSPVAPVSVDGEPLPPGEMAVLARHAGAVLHSEADTHLVVVGGAPLDGPRTIWWNFVASERVLIDQAAALWAAGGFEAVKGETARLSMPPRTGIA